MGIYLLCAVLSKSMCLEGKRARGLSHTEGAESMSICDVVGNYHHLYLVIGQSDKILRFSSEPEEIKPSNGASSPSHISCSSAFS